MSRSAWPAAVALSALLDEAFGEPPVRWHPVVWFGRYLSAAEPLVPAGPPVRALAAGGAAWSAGLAMTTLAAAVLDRAARRLPTTGRAILLGVALWPLWSGRLLLDEVAGVGAALRQSVPLGRAQLDSWTAWGSALTGCTLSLVTAATGLRLSRRTQCHCSQLRLPVQDLLSIDSPPT